MPRKSLTLVRYTDDDSIVASVLAVFCEVAHVARTAATVVVLAAVKLPSWGQGTGADPGTPRVM